LGENEEILHENIIAIKLEEEVRVTLAEANYKAHREKVLVHSLEGGGICSWKEWITHNGRYKRVIGGLLTIVKYLF
jgi:hypothetical protein